MNKQYMRRCIELARRSGGHHQPNPEVGSIVVCDGRIIGEGYHERCGSAHAEVNAIRSVAEADLPLLTRSTIYVTLEPCFHHGRTPPCVDLILRMGIPRVVIGCQDPFPQVAGKSIAKLRAAGVDVQVGVLENEIEDLNRRFFTQCRHGRPYIVLKYAQSPDGYMGVAGKNVRISNAATQRLLHRWRSEESAILVGTNTALTDNPQLTNRLYPLLDRQPIRLVLDRQGRLPQTLHLFDGSVPTWVFCEQPLDAPNASVEYIALDFSRAIVPQIVDVLHQRRIQSLLVEGGAALLRSFVDADLWDEARIFIGAQALGEGIAAPQLRQAKLYAEEQLDDNRLLVFRRTR